VIRVARPGRFRVPDFAKLVGNRDAVEPQDCPVLVRRCSLRSVCESCPPTSGRQFAVNLLRFGTFAT
jgi:hypothetical protein